MRRSLAGDVESPAALEGIVLRPYRDDDLRATYDVIEEAFSEHWGFEPFTFEEHVHEMARMDPSLIVMASVDGDAVGTAFASLIEGEGWVDVIGVLRPWRGRGAAKAMLLTLFAALRAVGARSVTLNVDSENDTGATALYEAVGMRVHHAWWVAEKRFAAAEPV
jgi:ribosomal protein S18 acetylase RimI-like enzyme